MRGNMSYCVNCGVELSTGQEMCPLCNTPVINPKDLSKGKEAFPFPKEKGQVETVKRKDLGFLVSAVVLATAITCGLLNLLVFNKTAWSLAVIGVCVILWVILVPVVIYTKQSIYVSVFFDGVSVAVYLYMLAYMIRRDDWLWGLGLPIVLLLTVLTEVFILCVRRLPKSFLTIALYVFTAIGIGCVGLEILIDLYVNGVIEILWSAVVVTVCVIVDITIITMLSRRRLRNAVRRRLHF